jgi:hypothetical protein
MAMGRRALAPSVAVMLMTVLLPVVINLATDTVPDEWRPWLWLAWPAAGVLGIVAVVLETRPPAPEPPPVTEGDDARLELAARALAEAVRRQWSEEAAHRGLRLHDPLRIRWSAVPGGPAGSPSRLRARGDLHDAVTAFRDLPRTQLLVLGEPGSGKSSFAVLLTLGLLDQPPPSRPVPVPVSLSSWRPTGEHLYAWLAQRLTAEYEFLGDAQRFGPDAAARLLTSGRVMPVLDGLDEMAAELRPAAIDHVNRFVQARPVVITSRRDEYRAAPDAIGQKVAFPAIQLDPVHLDEVERFLGDDRWQPVLAELRAHVDVPLASVLSSPLLLGLARDVYAPRGADPAALLDRNRFPDRESVVRWLLDAFIPVSYTTYPALSGSSAARVPYDRDRARGWLTFLARHLHHVGTDEIAWWRLHRALPRHGLEVLAGAACAVLTGPLVGLLAGLLFHPRFLLPAGLGSGLGVGLGVALLVGLRRGPSPSRILFAVRGRGSQVRRALALGLAAGPIAGTTFGLLFWLVGGVPRGLEIGTTAGLVAGTVGGLGVGVMSALRAPIESSRVVDPLSLLSADRAAALLQAGTGGLAAGVAAGALAVLAAGPNAELALPVVAGLGVGVGVALVAVCTTAWGQWTLTRLWLAARGRTPRRLMEFLHDAHFRGVLRHAGAVYQFRHALLQSHLVAVSAQSPNA